MLDYLRSWPAVYFGFDVVVKVIVAVSPAPQTNVARTRTFCINKSSLVGFYVILICANDVTVLIFSIVIENRMNAFSELPFHI
jgi:hypothetical protein